MQSLSLLLIVLLVSLKAYAQVPNQFAFQGVARNASGKSVSDQVVAVRFTLRQGAQTGTEVYQETHVAHTSFAGVFNVLVGSGSASLGSFSAINWSTGPYFLEVEMDINGGTNFVNVSTTQLQSVPYALTAKNLEGVVNPQEGETLVYKNGRWETQVAVRRYFVKGFGFNPSINLDFIGPTASITIEKDNPKMAIFLTKTLGSIGYVLPGTNTYVGASGLFLSLGYRKTGESIQKFDNSPDGEIRHLKVTPNTSIPVSLSGFFETTFKAGETYEIGIVGYSSVASRWNDNDRGMGFVEVSY